MSGYICAAGARVQFDEPCPRCGATDGPENERGCGGRSQVTDDHSTGSVTAKGTTETKSFLPPQ